MSTCGVRQPRRDLSVEDCFNLSDAMISDVSAVVSDYLQSGKPFSIVSVGRTVEDLIEEVPAARAAYVLRDDLSDLGEVLNSLLVVRSSAAERDDDQDLLPGRLRAGRVRRWLPVLRSQPDRRSTVVAGSVSTQIEQTALTGPITLTTPIGNDVHGITASSAKCARPDRITAQVLP